VEAANAEADRLTKESEAKRKAAQQDFEVTMAERRTKLTRAMEELEATSRAEAAQRIKDATDEANRLISSATNTADRKIAHAKELAEEMRVLRGRVLAQLLGIRGQLDSVPAMLAAVNRESELLDGAPEQRSLNKGSRKAISDSREDDIVDEERENANISG
ncbi:MAG: hypothetical protein JWN03_8107, partial [Nocardia sp.]|nr:hypothetical protein [Nocardia sp.]